jgi:hypothetical protein
VKSDERTDRAMIDPYDSDSPEDAQRQLTERWEQDISELEAEDWEFHFGGGEDVDTEWFYPDSDYE